MSASKKNNNKKLKGPVGSQVTRGSDKAVKTPRRSAAAEHRGGLNELNSWGYECTHTHTHTCTYSPLMEGVIAGSRWVRRRSGRRPHFSVWARLCVFVHAGMACVCVFLSPSVAIRHCILHIYVHIIRVRARVCVLDPVFRPLCHQIHPELLAS